MTESKAGIFANPAPLGLMGFAMTTILLNLHNAGIMILSISILAMGMFYGGLAQVIVGLMEWKKGNTFGTVAFTSYGFFWIALVAIILLPQMGIGVAADATSMAAFLSLWGLFTLFLFVGTLKLNRALQFVFGSLTVLFFLLALADVTGSSSIKVFAGFVGLACGFGAFYTGMAEVLNEVYGKTLMPIWPVSS
jgi:succinate-acetate transporter protein